LPIYMAMHAVGPYVNTDVALKAADITQASNANPAYSPVLLCVLVFIQVVFVTMVYGPIAAFLVELFPTKIRYTSMSLPYHIGNGWFGGLIPVVATAIVAATKNMYAGLAFPIIVALITFVVGTRFIKEAKNVDLAQDIEVGEA